MRKYNYPICGLFIIALAYFTFSGCETTSTGPSGSTAHLTVQRGPKLGSKSVLAVMVDGARVASLTEGQAYNGTLSPGQHVISVSVGGPTRFANPTKTVMAEKGQTVQLHCDVARETLSPSIIRNPDQESVMVQHCNARLRCGGQCGRDARTQGRFQRVVSEAKTKSRHAVKRNFASRAWVTTLLLYCSTEPADSN